MQKLVECVPNISEGRDRAVIDAVTAVIPEVDGVHLLDVDPGAETNRTVITFIGSPEGVAEAAFRVVKRAGELIELGNDLFTSAELTLENDPLLTPFRLNAGEQHW